MRNLTENLLINSCLFLFLVATAGAAEFAPDSTVAANSDGAKSVYAADMDNDGDMDILGAAAHDNSITWWENDGAQNFSEHIIDASFRYANSVYAADVDSDGDMDVLGAALVDDDIT